MAFTEDLSVFFDVTQGFAVTATWKGTTSVNGVFDKAFYFDTPGTAGIESAKPMFLCELAKMSTVKQGDTLAVNSVTYTVAEVHPDGTGLVALILED